MLSGPIRISTRHSAGRIKPISVLALLRAGHAQLNIRQRFQPSGIDRLIAVRADTAIAGIQARQRAVDITQLADRFIVQTVANLRGLPQLRGRIFTLFNLVTFLGLGPVQSLLQFGLQRQQAFPDGIFIAHSINPGDLAYRSL